MLWIWRFFVGFLTIKICGKNCEQILNRAVANGIHIWNLSYKGGYIYGNISVENFIKLFKIRHDIRCKIQIIKKSGLNFHLKKYKKRIGFLTGIIIFFAILIFLSNFVWIINIEGNKNISSSTIIAACKKIGIYEGVRKTKINSKYDAQRLQLNQNGIAWCSFNLEGSVLTVNLSEAAVSNETEREYPSNLKACIEGKIKKIDISSGNAIVKIGDTVCKGDLLVSGVVSNMSSTFFIHSSGEVIAETQRVFSAQGNFKQNIKYETGENIDRITINFFGVKIPFYLGKVTKNYNYKLDSKYLKIFNKKTPIMIAKEQYKITKTDSVVYSEDTLTKILSKDINQQVEKFNFISAKELSREIVPTSNGILLKITYACEENIAVQDEIILHKEN